MSDPIDTSLDFEESVLVAGEDRDEGERLTVTLEGYEGPLDLLLDLARRNRLDLRAISILDLADQYLAYIQEARRLKLEVAGDYLVMGAWLAYLKSRLILPQRTNDADPEAVDLASRLADRLQRLESVRHLGEMLGAKADARALRGAERLAMRLAAMRASRLSSVVQSRSRASSPSRKLRASGTGTLTRASMR
ncbi:segregation and condensation protein A [Rhabdaerophilum sp.]|uniref:segregation and condensation protein A n=1 Tax=Rhabdaerophilum sp. TaxID=2717341 RepID=UPI0038D420F4